MMRSLALTFMVSPLLRAGFNVFGDSASTHPALSPRLDQRVIAENRPGAGGNIAGEFVARAEPDGQTLFFSSIGTGAINYGVYGARMPWRPEEMAAVGLVTRMRKAWRRP